MLKKGLSLQEKYKLAKKSEDIIKEYKRIAGVSFIYIGKELKKIKDNCIKSLNNKYEKNNKS